MLKSFCDDCRKPLEETTKMVVIKEVIFIDTISGNRGARNLDFCDMDCCKSWLVKASNRPVIVGPNGQQAGGVVAG